MLENAVAYGRTHQAQTLAFLKEIAAIPSISTLPECREQVRQNGQRLVDELRRLGMARADLVETPLHPIVYAESPSVPGKPTVLIYGHYDVQPTDPLDEWETPPFVPTERGPNLYARGASDMKGSIAAVFAAIKALNENGGLPLNVKFLLEGAEEIGSLHLEEFMGTHRELLAADVVLNADGGTWSPEQPSMTYALRGLAYFEIEVHGPNQDLHSGIFGGSLHNPAQALCELIAGMHDAQGRVTLPGFYDPVRALDTEERQALARLPQTDEQWMAMAGVPALWGEDGYTTVERVGARPTLEVNGIISGFTGDGAKTVLPAKALAKISMRLVADQDSASIRGQLEAYMRQKAPSTITWQVRELSHGPSAITDRNSPAMRAAVKALADAFGKEPVFRREGGSVPVVGMMQQILGLDSVILGFGLPDDHIHGPNEKTHLPTLYRGIETFIRFFHGYAGTR